LGWLRHCLEWKSRDPLIADPWPR